MTAPLITAADQIRREHCLFRVGPVGGRLTLFAAPDDEKPDDEEDDAQQAVGDDEEQDTEDGSGDSGGDSGESDDEEEAASQAVGQRFSGIAATGRPFHHSAYGNFALDLAGLALPAAGVAVLREHDPMSIVGQTEALSITPAGLSVEGVIMDATQAGAEVAALAAAGFRWQMSVFVPPTAVEFVDEGVETNVNGHQFRGPGAIFRQSSLREVTVTATGADPETSTAFASRAAQPAIATETRRGSMTEQQKKGGATASSETQRCSAIFAAGRKANAPDEIVQRAIDEKMTVETAQAVFDSFSAGAASAASSAERSGHLAGLRDTPEESGQASVPDTFTEGEGGSSYATPYVGAEQSVDRTQWDADKALREEFGGNFDTFAAYQRNRHRATAHTGGSNFHA